MSQKKQSLVESVTAIFWEKLKAEGDHACHWAYAAVDAAGREPSAASTGFELRGAHAVKLYTELMKDPTYRLGGLPKVKGVLWEAMVAAWIKAQNTERSRPFAEVLSRIWQIRGEELAALNKIFEGWPWIHEERLRLVLEIAANDPAREGGEYAFVQKIAHTFAGRKEFLDLFKKR